MIKSNEDVVIVDVHLPGDYKQGHIPGAINLPNGRWHTAAGLSENKMNVVYCYSQTCHLAALEFLAQAYPVMEMEGGFAGCQAFGYPIEDGSAVQAAKAG